MPDIFDEVADDLRAERTRKFLLRYAGAFVGAAVLVLVGIGGWKAWQWHQHELNVKAAEQYMVITDRIAAGGPGLTKAGKLSDAEDLLKFAAAAPSGYATLAQFRAAGLYRDAGETAKAEAIWSALGAPNSSAEPTMRDLANLLWAQSKMGHAPNSVVMATLTPLMNPDNIYHDLAQFDAAVLDLQEKKTKEAKTLLQQVSDDPKTPDKLRQLAQGLLADLIG